MRHLDWQMIMFVGSSLVHDYWIIWGLPRVYYWDVKQNNSKKISDSNEDKKNAA